MSGSLGSLARIGLTLAATAYFGPVGGVVVGIAGNLLFPQKLPGVSGPRLSDQQFTTSTEGTAIPLVYGRHVVAGNFIWASPLDEVKHTDKQGGKGAPSQKVTTYTYYLSFAIALCDGPITGVVRIWENGKIVYDRRSQQDGESDAAYAARLAASDEFDQQLTIYLGDEEQLPDPIIESFEGVGEVSAHRGLAYVVIDRRDVTQLGGRPAQYQFEVTRAEIVYTPTSELEADVLLDWVSRSSDPRNPGGVFEYRYDNFAFGDWYDNPEDPLEEIETSGGFTLDRTLLGWHKQTDPGDYEVEASTISDLDDVDPEDWESLYLHYNRYTSVLGGDVFATLPNGLNPCSSMTPAGIAPGDDPFYWTGRFSNGATVSLNPLPGVYQFSVAVSSGPTYNPPERAGPDYSQNCTGFPASFGYFPNINGYADHWIAVRRVVQSPPIPGIDLPDWPIDPEDYTWDEVTGEIFSKQPWSQVAGDYRWLSDYKVDLGYVISKPLGPVVLQGASGDDEATWTAAYNAAVLAGTQQPGKTYNAAGDGDPETTYPINKVYAYARTFEAVTYSDDGGVTVGSIVRAQCERSGLTAGTDFDTSNLTKIIEGYKVERVMNGRDIIAPLRQYALFDGLETDKLRFPIRGGDVVATLGDDDLGAHEPGSTPPPLVQPNRIEDVELPVAVRVRYSDIDSEFQPGAQLATIKVLAGKDAQDIETTIAMDATAAAQMAEIILQEAVMRREEYIQSIGPHWLGLTATDPILFPLRGELQRGLITETTHGLPGIIEAKLSREDQSIYTSSATGVPGGAGNQTLTPIGDTDLVIIDGPALSSSSNDPGVFIAACGASDRWDGFGLFESTDGGSNYSRIAAFDLPATMGTLIDAIPEGPYEIWDYANSFRVAMDYGTLESRTQDEVLNGANAIFAGADGRWMVLQFCNADPEGIDGEGRTIYRLSTLLQGRQGTEWAIGTSQVGDRMALCSTVDRLKLELSDLGIPHLLKAVSFGRTTESGPTQTFTPNGVALKPYAPTLPEGQRDGSGNLDIYAVRRTRISAEWNDSDYVPLNEDVEAYEVDILSDGSPDTVLRTLSGTSFPIPYTAAQQTADFGSPQTAIRMRIYQISASVGRGYPCEATL